jgi:hypothetical protein
MAWRPTEYLLEGELDNTTPGKVTGWLQFAGMKQTVAVDLKGNFHRDIRGAKIRLRGNGCEDNPRAKAAMRGFAVEQTGETGDITAGPRPADYTNYPYLEWYGDQNGRVVIELEPDQVEVIGRPIPACESDPISREEQQQKMARFLAGLSQAAGVVAIAPAQRLVSDPQFTHWVVLSNRIVGEAHSVKPGRNGGSFAYVRLFNMPECAEYGYIETAYLRSKQDTPPADTSACDSPDSDLD